MALLNQIKDWMGLKSPMVERVLSPYNMEISSAAKNGDIKKFDKYYDMADPEGVNHYEPLSGAVWNGHLAMYKHLLTKERFRNHPYISAQDSFVSASCRGHLHIVQYILSPQFHEIIDMDDKNGRAFLEAARANQKDILNYFLIDLDYKISDALHESLHFKPQQKPAPSPVSDETLAYIASVQGILQSSQKLEKELLQKEVKHRNIHKL